MTDKEKNNPTNEPLHGGDSAISADNEAAPGKKDLTEKPATDSGKPLHEKVTLKGVQMYKNIDVDPETGELINGELTDEAREILRDSAEQARKAFLESEAGQNFQKNIRKILKQYTAHIDTAKIINQSIKDTFKKMFSPEQLAAIREITENMRAVQKVLEEIERLQAFIDAELSKPEYNGATISDLLNDYCSNDGKIEPGSPLEKVLQAARSEAEARGFDLQRFAEEPETLPEISYNDGTTIETSTDKLATMFFSVFAPPNKGTVPGQIGMGVLPNAAEMIPLKYEGKGKPITLFYDYAYNEEILNAIGLGKDFDAQDFFLMSICDNLFLEGNRTVSLTKIYREMNGKEPKSEMLNEIEGRLRRGLSTTIVINDKQVREAWNLDTGKFTEVVSPVMPVQIVNEKFSANGSIARSKVIINGLSPMYVLSKSLKHITTWDKEVLTAYTGRRTPRYWRVLGYLMQQIGWMRAPKSNRSNKITYSELYAETGAKSRRDQQATKTMLFKILDDVFKKLDYIKSYKEDTRGSAGVLIHYTPHGKRYKQITTGK